MKVSQDRIPNDPQTASLQAVQAANQPSPHSAKSVPSSSWSPHEPSLSSGSSPSDAARYNSSPLQAKRRVQPSLAQHQETEYEDSGQHDDQHSQDYGRDSRGSFHSSYGSHQAPTGPPPKHSYAGQTLQPSHLGTPPDYPEQYANTPGDQAPSHAQTTGNPRYTQRKQHQTEPHMSGQRGYRSQQGPYQAVVVFLLLLMALVIMAIVYQLFFRPAPSSVANSNSDKISSSAAIPSEKTPRETSRETEIPKGNETQDSSLRSLGAIPEEKQNAPSEPVKQSLSQSSPLSSVTPSGDEIPPTTPSYAPPQLPSDENQLLLQSKIGGIGYWIQVGAFSSLANANGIKQQLNQNHLNAIIQEGQSHTGKIYRVRVGLYTSMEETERILRQLKNLGKSFENSIITKIEL